MSIMVESFKRLYRSGSKRVTKKFLQDKLKEEKITQEEYNYIIGEKNE